MGNRNQGIRSTFLLWTLSLLLPHLSTLPALAATIHVPGEAPTIQDGIDAALDGDVVLVAPGTYVENINFLGKAITVKSEAGAGATVIDGGSCTLGWYTCPVVMFQYGESEASVLEGFTLRNGRGVAYVGHGTYWHGGGIYCYPYPYPWSHALPTSPTITDCVITENSAHYGGGLFGDSPTLSNCSITANSAFEWGGGVDCGSATLTSCTISGNRVNRFGGGGVYFWIDSEPTLANCTIRGNHADRGGGLFCDRNASPSITNCTITGNCADYGSDGLGEGGGIACEGARPVIMNSILWGNSAPQGPELWIGTMGAGSPSHVTIGYSDIQGGVPAVHVEPESILSWKDGNIDANPLFLGPGDYRLGECSPCIDAGDPDPAHHDLCSPPSLGSGRNDMGAYGGPRACGWCGDHDGDGHEAEACGGDDCDDADPRVHPEQPESELAGNCGDRLDNDCDGIIDTDPECGPPCSIGKSPILGPSSLLFVISLPAFVLSSRRSPSR